MFLNYLLAAVKAWGGLFHGNTELKGPLGSASQISACRGQPRLQVLVFTTLKVTWSSEIPRNVSPGDILASVPVLTSYTAFCTVNVMTDSSLNPPGCRGFGRTVCGHRRLWRVLAGWDVTPASSCLCTPSSAEGHVCDIISLLNKTSEIFNLALYSHVSWVQTALFYMITSINIVIPSTKGCHAFFLCANGPSFLETPISTYRYLQKKELSELGA